MQSTEREILTEARSLIAALWQCSDDSRWAALLSWIEDLLGPLAATGHLDAAFWLETVRAQDMTQQEAQEPFEKHLQHLAEQGQTDAMFQYSQLLYEAGRVEEAAGFCAAAAAAADDHPYANWCIGLDHISGSGVPRDEAKATAYIERAAELFFEGAIRFLADAYALGQHGYPIDQAVSASWHRKLTDKRLVAF